MCRTCASGMKTGWGVIPAASDLAIHHASRQSVFLRAEAIILICAAWNASSDVKAIALRQGGGRVPGDALSSDGFGARADRHRLQVRACRPAHQGQPQGDES